jgi:hypothetical protein
VSFVHSPENTEHPREYRQDIKKKMHREQGAAERKPDADDEEEGRHTKVPWCLDPQAVAGSLYWQNVKAPSLSEKEMEGRDLREMEESSFSVLRTVSKYLVDCVHVSIEGAHRYVLSWPFLLWPHSVEGERSEEGLLVTAACEGVLSDEILRLLGEFFPLEPTTRLKRIMHKAGSVKSGDTIYWWKATPPYMEPIAVVEEHVKGREKPGGD